MYVLVCMYVCVCVRVCVCINICIHMYRYICMSELDSRALHGHDCIMYENSSI